MEEEEDLRIPRNRPWGLVIVMAGLAALLALLGYAVVTASRPSTVTAPPAAPDHRVTGTEVDDTGVDMRAFQIVLATSDAIPDDARTVAEQTVVVRMPHADGSPFLGSGFVYRDGIVVSAAHVVPEGLGATVDVFCGERQVQGMVIGFDEVRDVLVVEAPGCTGTALRLDSRPTTAEAVHVAGFSFSGTLDGARRYHLEANVRPDVALDPSSMSNAATRRHLEELARRRLPRLVAIDHLLIPGNSGSPVYRGTEIVGIVVILDGCNGRSYFVPAVSIRHVLKEAGVRP